MTQQSTLTDFFKLKSTASPILTCSNMNTENKALIKRKLSLKKTVTPSKSPKVNNVAAGKDDVIDLCDDDEGDFRIPTSILQNVDDEAASDSSQSTIVYAWSPKTLTTPKKSPQSPSSNLKVRSPSSINKYFSPSKKRAVYNKPKKNLSYHWNDNNCKTAAADNIDQLYKIACEGMDDKTIFLLTIIQNYLNKPLLRHLLNEDSENLLEKCMHVVKPGMRLVCRLFWYKEGWYRKEKIQSIISGDHNAKIDDPKLHEILHSLKSNGLIIQSALGGEAALTFDCLTSVLRADELKQICKELKLKVSSKQEAIDGLRKYSRQSSIKNFFSPNQSSNASRVLKILGTMAGPCYKLTELARTSLHKLYILMYLGVDYSVIQENKLELILLYDKIKKETYPVNDDVLIDDASVVFRNNDEFERYVNALNVYEEFSSETDGRKKCDTISKIFQAYKTYDSEKLLRYQSLPIWLRRFTPVNLYVKVLEAGITDLKRVKQYELASDILKTLIYQNTFREHNKADWYAELALVLNKYGQTEEAGQVLLEGLKSNLPEEAKDILRLRAKTLSKSIEEHEVKTGLLELAHKETILENTLPSVHIHKQPMDRTQQNGKLKFETRTAEGRVVQDVEEVCLSYYIETGQFTDGRHWEGRIATTLFFLLFWDVIYSRPRGCPGVFLSRFQKFPLDLSCDSFYANRQNAIEKRLKEIEVMSTKEVLDVMDEKWTSRPETELSGIYREGISWEQVRSVGECLGARALSALCGRLAAGHARAAAGFPDLTLWNDHTKQIRFVEVKSDTDKPSIKQVQWMHYLQRIGIDTEFAYVGVHTTRSKARAK